MVAQKESLVQAAFAEGRIDKENLRQDRSSQHGAYFVDLAWGATYHVRK
jgi:hypothetical protein